MWGRRRVTDDRTRREANLTRARRTQAAARKGSADAILDAEAACAASSSSSGFRAWVLSRFAADKPLRDGAFGFGILSLRDRFGTGAHHAILRSLAL